MDKAQNYKRIGFVTTNYPDLQGFKQVVVGVFFVVTGLLTLVSSGLGWFGPIPTWIFPVMLVAVIPAVYFIDRYYRQNFGAVRRNSRSQLVNFVAAVVFVGVFLGVSYFPSSTAPFSPFGLAMAALFLLYYFVSTGQRQIYILLALIMAAVSLLPLTGWLAATDIFGANAYLGSLVFGALLIIGGLYDHWLLTNALKPLPQE